MKLTRRLAFARGPVDAAPLVNVILLLLIFFMLSSSFVLQPGIKVELPRSPFGAGVPAEGHIVTVLLEPAKKDADGHALPREPFLFFNDEVVKLADFRADLERMGKGRPGQTLIIKADREVPQGFVVELMNLAMAQKWTVVIATSVPMWAPRYLHIFGHALEVLPEEQRRLGLMLVLAALAHVAAFFCFSVVTPAAVPSARAKTRVVLYSAAAAPTPTLADFGFWSGINDPSLPLFPPDLMEGTGHAAAVAAAGPLWPSAVAAEPATAAVASDFDFLPDRLAPLPQRAEAVLAPPPPVFNYRVALFRPALAATTVEWSPALAERRQGLPAWALPDAPANLLADSGVTVLRLAVDAQGTVVHAVVDESSGRSEVDKLALDAARRLRFAPSLGARLLWGRATVFWHFTASAPAP